jgi:hypothetical protein
VWCNVLPDGKPNTPWRRLKLRIQTTNSLQVRCFLLCCHVFLLQQAAVRFCSVQRGELLWHVGTYVPWQGFAAVSGTQQLSIASWVFMLVDAAAAAAGSCAHLHQQQAQVGSVAAHPLGRHTHAAGCTAVLQVMVSAVVYSVHGF